MTTQIIIDDILNLTRKNGKKIASEQEVVILTNFRNNKDIERKDLTKLKKILAKYVPHVLPVTINGLITYSLKIGTLRGIKLSSSLTNFRIYISDDIMGFPHPDGYEIQKLKELKELTTHDISLILLLEDNLSIINAFLIGAIKEYTKERDAAAIKRKQDIIKGQVNKQILEGLTVIRNEWKEIVFKHTLEYKTKKRLAAQMFLQDNNGGIFTNNRENRLKVDAISDYLKDNIITYKSERSEGYVVVSDEVLRKTSDIIATNEADSFLLKMCDKICGLKLSPSATIENITGEKKNPFNSTMKIIDAFGSFNIFNQIVINTSPLGNPFYQYPCIFENIIIDGKKYTRLSEFQIKTKINGIAITFSGA